MPDFDIGGREVTEALLVAVATGVANTAIDPGELAYRRAMEQGKGREIPTDWLLEPVHP